MGLINLDGTKVVDFQFDELGELDGGLAFAKIDGKAGFFIEILLSKPVFSEVVTGLIPHLTGMEGLYAAVAILGATVMPHNLYLHSALVQTRKIGVSDESKRHACKYNLIDSTVA